jgi:NAD(P)-dependent dehydrogenase (short-subunit alcohol dehydrogenase family)
MSRKTIMRKGNTWALVAAAGTLFVVAAKNYLRRRNRIDIQGRSVLIMGASRGLGFLLARALGEQGARVAIVARSEDELERARQKLISEGIEVFAIQGDVGDAQAVDEIVRRVNERFGRIDILINNAGIIQVGPIEHMTTEDYQQAMATHLWGPYNAMKAVAPLMKFQGGGRIVNISSIGGEVPVPHLAPYTMSKFALTGLSDAFRAEMDKDNIKITTVIPGLMRTGSHVNALFKGNHRLEYAWFSITSALPVTSIDARKAAHQIVDACRHGDSYLTITFQARLLSLLYTIFPNFIAMLMKQTARLLPGPVFPGGTEIKAGWENQSTISPSWITRLADEEVERNNQLVVFNRQETD